MKKSPVSPKRSAMVGGAALLGALALSLGGAATANAHVTIRPDSAEAGTYAVLAVSVPHGCDGSATTKVAIQIPEGINSVTPTRNVFYTVDKTMEALVTPLVDPHGNEITERPSEVVYTATTPLPSDERDVFELVLKLPEEAAGSQLYFPTVQTCEEGEAAWVQIPADGQDPHDLEYPSPVITVLEPGSAGHAAHDDHDSHTADGADSSGPGEDGADSGHLPLVITSLAVGGLGLVAGAVALIRGGKSA